MGLSESQIKRLINNRNYWNGRFEQLEDARHNKSIRQLQDIEKAYNKTQAAVDKEIRSWYKRFADNNEISMAEAKRLLNSKELAEFQWTVEDYIKYGEENALNQQWMKQLENASARVHISRLEALKLQTQQHVEALLDKVDNDVDKLMRNLYESGYYHTAFEVQKGFKVGWQFASINKNQVDAVIKKPWAVDGYNFSDRIWANKQQLINTLHNSLTKMCTLGKAPDEAISEVAKAMNVSKNKAGKLVMTEAVYFGSEAQHKAFNELDVEKYEIVATLDSSTSDICRELDGKVFPISEYAIGVTAPPFHPWCRTVTAPAFDDFNEGGERAARGEDGKTYHVSADMTYKEWKKEFVKEQDAAMMEMIENAKPLFNAMQESGLMRMPSIDSFAKMQYNNTPAYKNIVLRYENLTGKRQWSAVEFNPETVTDHFTRHRSSIGVQTKEEYARLALEFVNNNIDKTVLICDDGVRRMYSENDNLFASVYADGTISTFYKPKTGKKYWMSQVKKYGKDK